MLNLIIKEDSIWNDSTKTMGYYISTFKTVCDDVVAEYLQLVFEKYEKLLQQYGAFTYAGDYYFKTEQEAQKLIDYLNKGTYLKDTKCLCEKDSADGIMIIKNALGKWELQFWGYERHYTTEYVLRDSTEIEYCPKCGKKLL